jgi:hypothetical protein
LLAAQPGELVGPLARGAEFLLYLVLDKVPPTASDADIASRAEAATLRRVIDPEIDARVKWHCQF